METTKIYARLTPEQYEGIKSVANKYEAISVSDYLRIKIAMDLNPKSKFTFGRKHEITNKYLKPTIEKIRGIGVRKNNMLAVELNMETYTALEEKLRTNEITISKYLQDLVRRENSENAYEGGNELSNGE